MGLIVHLHFAHVDTPEAVMLNGLTVTRLTAPGRGAVAVLQVDAGHAGCATVIDQHFTAKNGMLASVADVNRILYGHWGIEDVVVVRTAGLRWEVNCHGGETAATRITADLVDPQLPGAVPTGPQSPEARLQAEVLKQLLRCRTLQTARYLLAQQQGVLMEFLRQLSTCESYTAASKPIHECLSWQRFADHLTNPWQIAIVGRPNAGKSSLLNAIVGFDRAIVFDQPGTTRDRVETEIVLAGWPFRLIDTAGIREHATDKIESTGIDAAWQTVEESDACLLVVDACVGWTEADREILDRIPSTCSCAVLMNKTDLTTDEVIGAGNAPMEAIVIRTSAANGTGLKELTEWLPQQLVPEQPPLDAPLPVVPEFRLALQECVRQSSLGPLTFRE